LDHSVKPLPEHSMNSTRETEGKRLMSDTDSLRALSTIPWMKSECLAGSIVAVPAWLRSKCRPEGVMIPTLFCKGVKVQDDWAVAVAYRVRTSDSNWERLP
jgi:hypothetical protein